MADSNVDPERLGEFAFASRKEPELMRHRLVECPDCDCVYASPAPDAAATTGAYADAAYDSAAEARCAAVTYASLVERLLPRLPGAGGALDVGAGDGAFMGELLRLGFEDVAGVEPSSAPIAAAAPHLRDRFHRGAFDASHFERGRFALVTVLQTLEHVPEPLTLCREAATLLRPGGALLVVCHDRRALVNRALGLRSPIIDVEHLQLFSRRSLTETLTRAGLGPIGLAGLRNTYPLRYWLRLAPLPMRSRWIAAADRVGLGGRDVSLRVGNVAAVGFRPARQAGG